MARKHKRKSSHSHTGHAHHGGHHHKGHGKDPHAHASHHAANAHHDMHDGMYPRGEGGKTKHNKEYGDHECHVTDMPHYDEGLPEGLTGGNVASED